MLRVQLPWSVLDLPMPFLTLEGSLVRLWVKDDFSALSSLLALG